MRASSRFGGGQPPKSIVNGHSAGGTYQQSVMASNSAVKKTLSGELTANTLKSILTISGSGVLAMCYVSSMNATSRTMRLQIIVDGTTAFDATSAAVTAADSALIGAGQVASKDASGYWYVIPLPIPFSTSLDVKIASSLTETDLLRLNEIHWTT